MEKLGQERKYNTSSFIFYITCQPWFDVCWN